MTDEQTVRCKICGVELEGKSARETELCQPHWEQSAQHKFTRQLEVLNAHPERWAHLQTWISLIDFLQSADYPYGNVPLATLLFVLKDAAYMAMALFGFGAITQANARKLLAARESEGE